MLRVVEEGGLSSPALLTFGEMTGTIYPVTYMTETGSRRSSRDGPSEGRPDRG